MMNDETPLLSSDSEMASKIKKCFLKIFHDTFDKRMKFNCHALKFDNDDPFKNISKTYTFATKSFLTMLNLELDIISLKQLEYEMVCG